MQGQSSMEGDMLSTMAATGSSGTTPTNSPTMRKRRRPTSTPTRFTPIAKKKGNQVFKANVWTTEEDAALVEYLLSQQQAFPGKWPTLKDSEFWKAASTHVSEATSNNRTGTACRNRIRNYKCTYGCLEDAQTNLVKCIKERNPSLQSTADTIESDEELLQQCAEKMTLIMRRRGIKGKNQKGVYEFLHNSVKAVANIQLGNQTYNLVYGVAEAVAKMRPDNKKAVLKFNRMPYEMLTYNIQFANSGCQGSPNCPPAYLSWLESMYTQFGARFMRMFRGPYYEGIPPNHQYPWNCKFNIAAVGEKTINKHRGQKRKQGQHLFSSDTSVQVNAIKEVARLNPGGRYWIKSDGTDVSPCLQESKDHQWFGDSDMGDGKLQEMHSEYISRLTNTKAALDGSSLIPALECEAAFLKADLAYITINLEKVNKAYNKKVDGEAPTTERKKKELCWAVHEHEVVKEQLTDAIDTISSFERQLRNGKDESEIRHAWASKHDKHLSLLRNIYRLRRTPATHVMVVSISHEERRKKPYAIPVMYFPYTGITDEKFRSKVAIVRDEMKKAGLVPVGSVTDGEFNTCRTIALDGSPTSIFRLLQLMKKEINKLKDIDLLKMLVTVKVTGDKHIALTPNSVIPQDVLKIVHDLNLQRVSLGAILTHIRNKLLPGQHNPTLWPGMTAGVSESLKTIVGTYMYRQMIDKAISAGKDFSTHMYVPEWDPVLQVFFHDREDHHHIFKRIAGHTRLGGPSDFDGVVLDEVLTEDSGMTEAALKGTDKQSVPQAEQLLSHKVAATLARLGYPNEAHYIKTVANWHEAHDGRAIKPPGKVTSPAARQLTRSRYNYEMLNLLLNDYMPWSDVNYDFRLVDINRDLKGICGMSRETIIGVVTTIESQEHRRRDLGLPVEHPRAGDTNDSEQLFSIFREHNNGETYTLKRFQYTWAPLCSEFLKQLDDDLPFWYETVNQRFSSGSLQAREGCFDHEEDGNPERLHSIKAKVRDSCAIFIAGRASCPMENSKTIRTVHFKKKTEIFDPKLVCDHDYA